MNIFSLFSMMLLFGIFTKISDAEWTVYSGSLPRSTWNPIVGELNDEIYLLSGYVNPRQAVKIDTQTDTVNDIGANILDASLSFGKLFDGFYWAQISNLLYAKKRLSTTADPNIYVFDLSTPTYYQPTIIYTPSPYNLLRSCLAGNDDYPYLYQTGGSDGSQTQHLQIYDINMDIWYVDSDGIPSMQVARSHHSCVIDDNGYLYAVGGWDNGNIASIERIQISSIDDLKNGVVSWEYIESLPAAIRGTQSVNCNGKIYVLGGYTTVELAGLRIIDPNYPNTPDVSTSSDSLSYGIAFGSAICVDCSVYYFGGYVNGAGRKAWSKYEIPDCSIDEPTPTPTSPVTPEPSIDTCEECLIERCGESVTVGATEIVITCTEPTTAPTFTPCTCDCEFNINFILDESWSVNNGDGNENNYGNMIDFVQNLILYDINSVSKISAFAYSRDNDPIHYFMDDQESRDEIISALEEERSNYKGSITDTYNAIARGIDMFSEDGVIEIPDQNFIFLLTDGEPYCGGGENVDSECQQVLCLSADETSEYGEALMTELEERNIRLYILGIGSFESYSDQVSCLTESDYIYQIEDFTSDEFKLIEAEFREILCPDNNI